MEIIPRTLAENSGLDPIDKLVELKAAHERGEKTAGLDVYTGKVVDMWQRGVIEPLRLKKQAMDSAVEAAIMILTIDDVIASSREAPQAPPPGAGGGMPGGYDVNGIDVSTIMLNDKVQAEVHPTEVEDYDNDDITDLMVKFDRSAVQEILEVGDDVKITITGELIDGTPFEGSDTIRVIDKCEEINFDLSMEFLGSAGKTIADENGLTYYIDDERPWTDGRKIYPEEYWGEYPFYFSSSDVGVKLTITNKGKEPEAGFDIECTAFQLNTDGSNGASIMTPQTRNIRVANGETMTIDIIFPLPLQAKNLNRFIVSIYTEGTLRMAKEGIFCPPEELK
jgi:hypothetical protein